MVQSGSVSDIPWQRYDSSKTSIKLVCIASDPGLNSTEREREREREVVKLTFFQHDFCLQVSREIITEIMMNIRVIIANMGRVHFSADEPRLTNE